MVKSRLQQKYRRRTALSLILSVFLVVGLAAGSIFYLPEIILSITSINSKLSPQSQNADTNSDTTAPLTPELEPLPETTSNSLLIIAGATEPGAKVYLYHNSSQISTTSTDKEGGFSFEKIKLDADKNKFYVVAEDFSGNMSNPSISYTVILKTEGPTLSVAGEVDNKKGKAIISGETDSDATITINSRRAIVNRNGSFSLELKLNPGENKLLVVATDPAENITEQELTLNYSPED